MGSTRKADRLVLGQLYATPDVLAACERAGVKLLALLERHTRGDGGELGCHNIQESKGMRVKSSYPLSRVTTVWVVTEPDRSVTLLLLPEEF